MDKEFKEAMKRANIKILTDSYDPLRLSLIHPARDDERKKLDWEHAEQVTSQWNRTEEAAKFTATRTHFAKLVRWAKSELRKKIYRNPDLMEVENDRIQ